MKYGFTKDTPYPQPDGKYRADQLLHGLEEEVEFLKDTAIRVWFTHKGTCYPPHWHRCMEIIECVNSVYVIHAGAEEYTLSPGDILVVPGGLLHDLNPGQDCNGWVYLFDLSWMEHIASCRPVLAALTAPVLISRQAAPTQHAKVSSLLSRMRNDYFSDNPMREALFDSSVLRLMERLARPADPAREAEARLDKCRGYDALFIQVARYVDEHFAENLTLEDVARRFNLSPAYFSRLFKQYVRDSFSAYLANRRFTEAERLLMNSNVPVTEVAFRCGYNSPAVFSRAFQAHRKCSPSKFRAIYASFERRNASSAE